MDFVLKILIFSGLAGFSSSEWVATHAGLPSDPKIKPESFSLSLTWQSENDSKPKSVSLELTKAETVATHIPVYKTDMNGRPYQSSLANLRHTTFYHDVTSQASVSLTSFNEDPHFMKGSFLLDNDKYEFEPYHPEIHKRSTDAREGSTIVTKASWNYTETNHDYILPEKGTEAWKLHMKLQKEVLRREQIRKRLALEKEDTRGDNSPLRGLNDILNGKRSKRQSLPDTTYIVQLYIVVDYYLYQKLSDSATRISWPGTAEDYILFVMGHTASQIDVRYRNIDAPSVDSSYTWSIGTKLSYIQIAETTGDSSWTYPSGSGQLDSSTGLDDFTTWITDNSATLPADADHYMLVTSLDLTSSGSTSNAGLAWVENACGNKPSSINEFGNSAVLAHELGHNLGASHDGTGNICDGDDDYVMAASTGITDSTTVGNPWLFSSCSVDYFDAYITRLNNDGTNCLTNDGSYIASWTEDHTGYLGQKITVDEQCKLKYGDDYYYWTTKFSDICQAMWCTNSGSSGRSGTSALPYTTCGDGKWCVEELCVSDPAAPALDENCPFGDFKGTIFSNSDLTCETATAVDCAVQISVLPDKCCATCPTFEKPWLGPNCPYGDKNGGCVGMSASSCSVNSEICCDSCCKHNGAESGYSCDPPSTTTGVTTTSTAAATTLTTTSPTTTTIGSTTKSTVPTTSTTASTTSTTASTTSTTASTTSTTASTTSTTASTTSTTASTTKSTTSTAESTTPTTTSSMTSATTTTLKVTQAATTAAAKPRRGKRTRRYSCSIRIVYFATVTYDCKDTALQDTTSNTYQDFYTVVCDTFRRYIFRITVCGVFKVSCGSLIVNSTIEVEENDDDDPAKAAPANSAEFLQQISGITSDPELGVTGIPTIADVDECADSELNDCSPNAACTNLDGYYNCTCKPEYSMDLSVYADEPGRICAIPCTDTTCSDKEVCEEQPEAEPACECPSGKCKGLETWVYVIIGTAAAVIVIALIVVVAYCCCKKPKKVTPKALFVISHDSYHKVVVSC